MTHAIGPMKRGTHWVHRDDPVLEVSFERALEWYEKAVSGLEFAVDNGETWYEKALSGAHAGSRRCRQEIAQ